MVSAALIASAATFTWNALLNDEAKASARRAGRSVTNLGAHFAESYMGIGMRVDDMAVDRNRAWVEQQWKEAGY